MMLKTVQMLLVEDNPGDVYLIHEAICMLGLQVAVRVAPDGQEAMDILRRDSEFIPDIVVLDLNLPIKNGQEVLEEMNEDPMLRGLPVAIFTSSTAPGDVALQHRKANCRYFVKTGDMEELAGIMSNIYLFATEKPA